LPSKKEETVESANLLKGLCATCVNASNCTYLESQPRSVYQCDEYHRYPPVNGGGQEARPAVPAAERPAPVSAKQAALLGLCRTCDGWETCEFSRAEGGVWRCEEYQ
jgi:hypothetical protein